MTVSSLIESRRLRYVFSIKSGATPSSSTPEYWNGDIHWVTPEDLGKLSNKYVYSTKRKLTEEGLNSCGSTMAPSGSLVFSKRAPIGQSAILATNAACNQGCFLLTGDENTEERFFYYCLVAFRPHLEVLGRGSTFMELPADELKSFSVPFPSQDNRKLIANYLDRETARIDALVAEKERMLALLEEKRAALISRAVTRGLNPNAPLKPSGLDWLGDIPEHWETKRIKHLTISIDQGASPVASNTPAEPDELGILKLSAIKKGLFVPYENKALKESAGADQCYALNKGDVLITRGNTPQLVADVAYVPKDYPNLLIPDLVYRLRVDTKSIDPLFLASFLTTENARVVIRRDARGSSGSMVKVSQGHVLDWRTPLPPREEQTKIVDMIVGQNAQHQIMRTDILHSIVLLKERRSALITAAVTGQIPLKDMAA